MTTSLPIAEMRKLWERPDWVCSLWIERFEPPAKCSHCGAGSDLLNWTKIFRHAFGDEVHVTWRCQECDKDTSRCATLWNDCFTDVHIKS